MADEEDFEPRLGRQRHQGAKRARRYAGRVIAAANLARGGAGARSPAGQFSGSRLGRGAGIGRLFAAHRDGAVSGRRRVVVKARIVKLSGKGAAAATAHLRYLQRDGTTRAGERGQFYGHEADDVDRKAFEARGVGDRHQFRFIVSPEDGDQYEELKQLTRRLMARMEDDLGTRLDWIAVDHFNTGYPHSHIVLRGKDGSGADLVIARDYLTWGIRERASELVDLDLGPRTRREIDLSRRAEVKQERLTSLDRALLSKAGPEGVASIHGDDDIDQPLRVGRLAKLAQLGLAEPIGAGRYRLASDLAHILRRLGERGDIIRTMQREFARADPMRTRVDQHIYDPAAPGAKPLTGAIMARGLADEHADRHYLIVDATDGRSHYVAIGQMADGDEDLRPGAIVRIEPAVASVREADRIVSEVAAGNGGLYDVDAHLRHDPRATEVFAQAHVRRLEAMRRLASLVERTPSGHWIISEDHLARVAAFEARKVRDRPVVISLLSAHPLDRLAGAEAATWIDRELVSDNPLPLREAGFGQAVRDARNARARWLATNGFAQETVLGTVFPAGMIARLERHELQRAAVQLSQSIGLPFSERPDGTWVEGIYRRRLDLVSGRFAVIEHVHDFTLVPWRPALERQLGKSVSGMMKGDGISWSVGRGRNRPGPT